MVRISLCMITKNEGKLLSNCLNSVKDLVDEIIIVDTGSADGTKDIALSFGAKIYDFNWRDDFASARNESLKHANGDWILVLDGDEELDDQGKKIIREILMDPDAEGYNLSQLHYTNHHLTQTGIIRINHPSFKGYHVSEVIRLFKHNPEIFFDYCVHETVRESILRKGGKIKSLEVCIHHYQELKGIEDVERKQELYFRLSLNNIKHYPNYAKSYNDVAIYYAIYNKDNLKALGYCRKAVELDPEKADYLLNLSYRLRDLDKDDEAIIILNKYVSYQENELVYRALGYMYYKKKLFEKAYESYNKALILGTGAIEEVNRNLEILKKLMNRLS